MAWALALANVSPALGLNAAAVDLALAEGLEAEGTEYSCWSVSSLFRYSIVCEKRGDGGVSSHAHTNKGDTRWLQTSDTCCRPLELSCRAAISFPRAACASCRADSSRCRRSARSRCF